MGRLHSIVLVESNPLDALTVGRAFALAGQALHLVHCLDCLGALTYLQRPKDDLPCLVIFDLDNGREDNLALLRYLKGDAAYRHLPTLVLAASPHHGAMAEMQSIGIDDYLIKPADYHLFGQEITHFLKRWAHRLIAA